VYSLECIAEEFSEPFGLKISEEETPEIWKLLRDAKATCENISGFPKYFYKRKRPFVRFQEHTATPQFEPELRRNFSYPSGHTILGWTSALLLTEINPERADTILARGMMYGESRVIVGAHWQSDVDAGRLAAAAVYARMHTSERFLEQMQLARQEFRCKAGLATIIEMKAYRKAAQKKAKSN
jgi:acid phosphatase (class A)